MAYILSDNIISPLGETSEENYLAVKSGKSGIRTYAKGYHDIAESFTGSFLFADFKKIVFRSVKKAISKLNVDIEKQKVAFILSSTKGDIESLGVEDDDKWYLSEVAKDVALTFGMKPFVVCNACVSGLSALILASRLLDQGSYDYAVVCGCDTPKGFIISGFQSLKALSLKPCKPFDMDRSGLNLGEAAATLVLSRVLPQHLSSNKVWTISKGFVRNDAYHISAPSKTAEGLYKALRETLYDVDKANLAFINVHGTATLFNDQMESLAIQRANLSEVPINALKGYFGHTLGAAGVLETILCMQSVDDNNIIGTYGYEELGVSGRVNVVKANSATSKKAFVKMLSGFGGCNATVLVEKKEPVTSCLEYMQEVSFIKRHKVSLSAQGAFVDGKAVVVDNDNGDASLLTAIYKQKIGSYIRYYKMDGLCRLGFVASELLLQAEGKERFKDCDDRAVVLFNRSSSISSDRKYLESIQSKESYYPSPLVFVYTLPNIVTGEIAIRNHYHGETSFYILPQKSEEQMYEVLDTLAQDKHIKSVLTGWIDYEDDTHFEVDLELIEIRNK